MVKFDGNASLKMPKDDEPVAFPLLSTAYLPPVSYFSILKKSETVFLEQYEHYIKQTYRNRCKILTANGVMSLVIPVEKIKNERIPIRDVRLAAHVDWQTQHWRALKSAYNSTPFFEFYADDLLPFYKQKWRFLLDFNLQMLAKLLELTDIQTKIILTENYQMPSEKFIDSRNNIHPKKNYQDRPFTPYYQVFRERFGFSPDLSVVDLLFNMGNESLFYLED
ncbi:MAG: WbqC family protein [Prevotellaceae bacterium]|jgi:hypothetical protein|nr:WbqC family protein [Prevotellaceae bacterium]